MFLESLLSLNSQTKSTSVFVSLMGNLRISGTKGLILTVLLALPSCKSEKFLNVKILEPRIYDLSSQSLQ